MNVTVLPDRERRHLLQFYLAPKMGYRTRLGLAAGLIATGLLLQLLWPSQERAYMVTFSVLLLAGNAFLLVRGYNLRPRHRLSRGDWEKTTRDRFRQVRELEKKVRSWDETFADCTCVTGLVCLAALAATVAFVTFLLNSQAGTRSWAPVFAIDAAVLLLPHWVTGTRRGWKPVTLRQHIDSVEAALKAIESFSDPPCQIQPMLNMAGKGDKRVPIEARAFIRFPDGPEEFLGLQFQVSVNDVQGTKYPYLYAVIVARPSSVLCATITRI
ncbi:MAG: hypothetical protein ACC628_06325 [Pirellulaceae bacterium]